MSSSDGVGSCDRQMRTCALLALIGDPQAGANLVSPSVEDGYLLLAGAAAVSEPVAAS